MSRHISEPTKSERSHSDAGIAVTKPTNIVVYARAAKSWLLARASMVRAREQSGFVRLVRFVQVAICVLQIYSLSLVISIQSTVDEHKRWIAMRVRG